MITPRTSRTTSTPKAPCKLACATGLYFHQSRAGRASRDHVRDYVAVNIGEAAVDAVVTDGELGVVDA